MTSVLGLLTSISDWTPYAVLVEGVSFWISRVYLAGGLNKHQAIPYLALRFREEVALLRITCVLSQSFYSPCRARFSAVNRMVIALVASSGIK